MALVQNFQLPNLTWHHGGDENSHSIDEALRALQALNSLPKRFPPYLSHELAWLGSKLPESTYVHHLSAEDCLELKCALGKFKEEELDGDLVNRENFPLPNLQHALESLCHELHDGKGFFLLRGFDLENYSVEDGMIIFLGIQAYIAEQRARQDDRGNMVVHIISDSTAESSPARSLHSRHSKASIAHHTEETGDIIAWQTRNTAARGGKCIIASAYTIYNILAAIRPDIIRTLAKPDWPFALPTFHFCPILYYHSNRLIINFCRAALLGSPSHPRCSSLPNLSAPQLEALNMVETLARATELEITTRRGDIHFVNNLAVLHRRSEFVDDETTGTAAAKRHLVRMRLRNAEHGWDLPAELRPAQEEVFKEEGGRVWHIEPMPEAFFPLRKYLL